MSMTMSSTPLTLLSSSVRYHARARSPTTRHILLTSCPHRATTLRRFTCTPTLADLRFSIGVSYANKSTPPFVERREADESALKGFQPSTKIGRWKQSMLALGGGREELFDTKRESREDDWQSTQGAKGVQDRRRWGSGEDAFMVNDEVGLARK
jgi:hypothetical protein